MSSALPVLDVSAASIGSSFKIDFTSFVKFNPSKFSEVAHLMVFNESGCGLHGVLNQSGQSFFIPAGGWVVINVSPQDSFSSLQVTYILPNAPISQVITVYYPPGEEVPPSATLGNSPIGISGSVSTTNIQALSNETNPINTLVIDIGPVGNTNVISIYNDHFIWSVVQSGIAHQVLKGNIAGNPLQIGQAGDTSEVLGTFTIDQVLNVTGASNLTGAVVTTGNVTVNGSLITNTIRDNVTGVSQMTLATAGVTFPNTVTLTANLNLNGGSIFDSQGNGVIAVTDTGGTTQNTRLQSTNVISFQVPGGTTIASVSGGTTGGISIDQANTHGYTWFNNGFLPEISFFTGTGSGTYNHNFNGTGESLTPFWICPIVSVAGSATQGYDTVNATQCHVTLGAALAFKALAL